MERLTGKGAFSIGAVYAKLAEYEEAEEHGELVRVVRCGECKHYQPDGLFGDAWCDGKRVKADWFCADGERGGNDEADT